MTTYTFETKHTHQNPILDELAPLVGAQHGLRIGKVDATQQGKIAKEFGVTGWVVWWFCGYGMGLHVSVVMTMLTYTSPIN